MNEQKASLEKILSFMINENDWVKSFDVSSEGTYTVDDAIWNYKDAPHLNFVHSNAMGCQTLIGDNHLAALHTQKILGIKLPMTLVEYQAAPNELVYFSTIIFFTLLVNTKIVSHKNITRVQTKYFLSGPWYTKPLFFIMKKIIIKNYKILMSEDIPMRERKAHLRTNGYVFSHDNTEHSWFNSTKIAINNLITPQKTIDIKVDLLKEVPYDGKFLFGNSDAYGFILIKDFDTIKIFPRICKHEGASLDNQVPDSTGIIKCPWHGRNIPPLAKFKINTDFFELNNSQFIIKKVKNIIKFRIDGNLP